MCLDGVAQVSVEPQKLDIRVSSGTRVVLVDKRASDDPCGRVCGPPVFAQPENRGRAAGPLAGCR